MSLSASASRNRPFTAVPAETSRRTFGTAGASASRGHEGDWADDRSETARTKATGTSVVLEPHWLASIDIATD